MFTSFKLYRDGLRRSAVVRCGAIGFGLSSLLLVLATMASAQEAAAPVEAAAPAESGVGQVILPPTPEGDNKFPEVIDAKALFDKGDFDGAFKMLETAKQKYPQLFAPRILMARMALARGEMNLAHVWLEQAVAEAPNDPSSYELIGEIAFRENRLVEADMVLNRAFELMAAYEADEQVKRDLQIQLHSYRSVIAMKRQQWPAAERELRAWIELAPDTANAHFNLAQVLFAQQQYDAAFAELEAAAKTSELFPPADVVMGRLYAQANDLAKAEECMLRALEKNPKDTRTLLGVADWRLTNGNIDDAWLHSQAAAAADPASIPALLMAGTVARFRGDNAAAEKYFEQVFLQSPTNFQAADQLALVLVEQDDDAKRRRALELAETNARQHPNDPAALATLGWVYFKHKRVADALKVFQALSRSMRISGDSAYYMANVTKELAGKSTKPERFNETISLLTLALQSNVPFVHRADAERMLKELGGTVPAATGGANSSAPTSP